VSPTTWVTSEPAEGETMVPPRIIEREKEGEKEGDGER